MKRGPRRQRSNGFLIHEGTDAEEAERARWVGQRYMVGGGAVPAMHGQAWEGTFFLFTSSPHSSQALPGRSALVQLW